MLGEALGGYHRPGTLTAHLSCPGEHDWLAMNGGDGAEGSQKSPHGDLTQKQHRIRQLEPRATSDP